MSTELDNFILSYHPALTGKNGADAQHEIHLFLVPLNPEKNTLEQYYSAVDEWNLNHQPKFSEKFGDFKMKACFLCLIFRDGPVRVMQSAIYAKSNELKELIEESHAQKAYFESKGFTMVREKIEAMAFGIDDIPMMKNDLPIYPSDAPVKSPYFEFHIKCKFEGMSESDPLTEDLISILKECSEILTLNHGSPVPLSYNENPNKLGNDNQGNQRFFNLRYREMGLEEIKPQLKKVKNFIEREWDLISSSKICLEVIKTISEYVWYDTQPSIDMGWIDFNQNEGEALLASLRERHPNYVLRD